MADVKNFKRIAVCNRGEVAVRIIEACHQLGIEAVLLHSQPDIGTRAYRMADDCVLLTGDSPYLDIKQNAEAAKKAMADAVHPGFGFLSENADFAEAIIGAGLSFIGPMPDSIRNMGDKISAKKLMEEARVPCIPGYKGEDQSLDRLKSEATEIGFPVLIKAAAGGGGRGMKVSRSKADFAEQLDSAKRESLAAFGSDQVFLEKYLENTKHIEFQIFGDQYGNYVHLFERECSVQRRHQKIIEEAPSPSLDEETRKRMAEAALRAAEKVNYVGAGTVEFLLAGQDFYFLEMNTRLQVEHPVTEYITGKDLVQTQIKVAMGSPLPFMQSQIEKKGHSIECRLYAEDPYKKGIPSTGEIFHQKFPKGEGRRFDYAFDPGDSVTSFYDPMIGKLIVHAEDREAACKKMIEVLQETEIFGIQTNIDFLVEIINHPEFFTGVMTTGFIEEYFSNALGEKKWSEEELQVVEHLMIQLANQHTQAKEQPLSAWQDAWRNV
ncbi:MAG: pyruvate carboxylase subunit A [Bdellovibrionaceae bacterium]|nr:pyruvate carboxylase subunit A [Pseudobdellovibrionaceae bacterium]|tara:strand:- start:43589 stop:45067 length:1479 start_codon:yes stop_codon:yes gene_type:complete